MSLFQKIINREIDSEIIYENNYAIVIKDINPQAPIHYLIIPKEFFITINDISDSKMAILIELFKIAKDLSQLSSDKTLSYRIVINNGENAGQVIPHLHVHFLSWDT